MAAALADVLEAVRANIESSTGAEVALGASGQSASGLILLPYKIRESAEHRNQPRLRDVTNPPAAPDLNVIASCLLLPNTPSGHAALGEGLSSLYDHHIITVSDTRVAIEIDDLPSDELAAICSAAGITLTLAVSLKLRWVLGRKAGST